MKLKFIVNKLYFFQDLFNSAENIEVCLHGVTRIRHQLLPHRNGDFGVLLKNVYFSAVKNKLAMHF